MLESVGKKKVANDELVCSGVDGAKKHESGSMIFGVNSYSIDVVRGGE